MDLCFVENVNQKEGNIRAFSQRRDIVINFLDIAGHGDDEEGTW